ncbi:hypothetical protein Tco_0046182 [Tanacetum coccineum]
MLEKLAFVRLNFHEYGRRMVKEVRVEIHGFNFLVDFMVIDYANKGEPSVMSGRDFLVTTKCKIDFAMGEIRLDLIMLEKEMNLDILLVNLVKDIDEVRSTSGELLKMGKANRNKGLHVNKLTPPALPKIEEIPQMSSYCLLPVYHPLSTKQKEKILEVLNRKYKDLEEKKPILEVLENYMIYRKKLDEIMMGRARLENKSFCEEEKENLIKNGLSKKMCDPDSNVYQAYLVDFLVLDIPVDKELLLLLGHRFLRTCGAIIDMGRGTMAIDDSVIRHTYFLKLRAKPYLENFEMEEEDDWLGCFKVGRDEDGYPKYGPVAPSFLDIEDDME